ncbi:MAG: carbon-nitrogen hydrolase family protein [Anaerolineae bacterium]|jgi:predicted amidohydrolase
MSVLACGQFAPTPGDLSTNTATMLGQMEVAADRGADLIVFPELALTGYLPPEEVAPLAVAAEGPELAPLREAAARLELGVALGFPELANGVRYNSMVFLSSAGDVSYVYRKTHLWDTERQWAAPGTSVGTFDAGGMQAGMWICYDTRFPEVGRLVAAGGGTLALVATAWLGPAAEWELALRARALDNGLYVVGSALQGAYASYRFNGPSLIVDPHGNVLARAPEGRNEVITAQYEPAVVRGFRARLPLLSHRRLDVYQPLWQARDW